MGEFALGQPVPRFEDPRLIRGGGRYVDDLALPHMAYGYVLRSPHAHARIRSIDKRAALAVHGVHAVFTYEDAPQKLYSTARHEFETSDPDDTMLLDRVVRFVGQRVAAVVADSEAEAELGCRKIMVEYEVLPAVVDPEDAMRPGAPAIHGDKGPETRIRDSQHNIAGEVHGDVGDV